MKQELLKRMSIGFKSSVNTYKDPLAIFLKNERNEELLHRLESLSSSELSLLYALFYEEIGEADYALRNNMDENTVKNEKKRILAKLRESYQKKGGKK